MSKHQHQPQAKTAVVAATQPARLPGDPLPADEQRRSQESTLAQIKAEMAAEKASTEARDRALAADHARHGVQVTLPGEVTIEMRAKSHAASVNFIKRELEEQNAINPPRPLAPQGGDDATVDMIKAEMARSQKRIVLPSG